MNHANTQNTHTHQSLTRWCCFLFDLDWWSWMKATFLYDNMSVDKLHIALEVLIRFFTVIFLQFLSILSFTPHMDNFILIYFSVKFGKSTWIHYSKTTSPNNRHHNNTFAFQQRFLRSPLFSLCNISVSFSSVYNRAPSVARNFAILGFFEVPTYRTMFSSLCVFRQHTYSPPLPGIHFITCTYCS